jgi:hypothetical protein
MEKARQERERAERQSERQAEAERLEKIRGDALKTQDVEASLEWRWCMNTARVQ